MWAAGEVNSYGARRATCERQEWPTNANRAREALARWDPHAVADALIARVLASPRSADNVAPAARGSEVLAQRIVASLRSLTSTDPRRYALLRLALEVDGGDPEALRDDDSTRAAVVIVRWSRATPKSLVRVRALATIARHIDNWTVMQDLAAIGPAASAALTPANRARMWRMADTKLGLKCAVDAVAAARVEVAPRERGAIARAYDRICEAPNRRLERELGEWFTSWSAPDDCTDVYAWLDAARAKTASRR